MAKINRNEYDPYGIDPDDFKIDPSDYDFHPDENEKHDDNNKKELSNRIDNSCYVNKKAHEEEIMRNKKNGPIQGLIAFLIVLSVAIITLVIVMVVLGGSSSNHVEEETPPYYLTDVYAESPYYTFLSNDSYEILVNDKNGKYYTYVCISSEIKLDVVMIAIDGEKYFDPYCRESCSDGLYNYDIYLGELACDSYCIDEIRCCQRTDNSISWELFVNDYFTIYAE